MSVVAAATCRGVNCCAEPVIASVYKHPPVTPHARAMTQSSQGQRATSGSPVTSAATGNGNGGSWAAFGTRSW